MLYNNIDLKQFKIKFFEYYVKYRTNLYIYICIIYKFINYKLIDKKDRKENLSLNYIEFDANLKKCIKH